MSWLTGDAVGREDLLAMHPDLAKDHAAVLHEIWRGTVDPKVLELCRLRMATLLSNTQAWSEPRTAAAVAAGLDEQVVVDLAKWPSDPRFDETTRACLALAEQYVLDIHGVTDDQVSELTALIGANGVVTLTTAFATWEISHRFDNALLGGS